MSITDSIVRMFGGMPKADVQEAIDDVITSFRAEDQGWLALGNETGDRPEPSAAGRETIYRRAELYWFTNPLIGQAVNVKTNYTFGRGVQVTHKDPKVNSDLLRFWKDPQNKAELTSFQAQTDKDHDLQVYGNVFLVLFPQADGRVVVRSMPAREVKDVVTDPDDARRVLYYRRERTVSTIDFESDNFSAEKVETKYYMDWRYYLETENKSGYSTPDDLRSDIPKPPSGKLADGVIMHIYVNKLSGARFGTSDIYRALDWAKAHKDQLEDWATIIRALSQFSWKRKGRSALDVKQAAVRLGGEQKDKPADRPATVASILHQGPGTDWDPISVPKGATTSPEDSRQLKLMVAAATGVFEHYFGDPATGNLSTSTAMELPMLKMFEGRQQLWEEIYKDVCEFVIRVKHGSDVVTEAEMETVSSSFNDKTAEILDGITVEFPPIIQKNIVADAQALILGLGASLGEDPLISPADAAALFMSMFGVDDVQDKVKDLKVEWEEHKDELRAAGIMPGQSKSASAKNLLPPANPESPEDKLKKSAEALHETARIIMNLKETDE